jgi:cytochrome c553
MQFRPFEGDFDPPGRARHLAVCQRRARRNCIVTLQDLPQYSKSGVFNPCFLCRVKSLPDRRNFCAFLEEVTEMARKLTAIAIVASFGVASVAQAAGNAAAGKDKSAVCAGCHGDRGQGIAPNPALAGKPEADLVKALKDFKSGKPSVMHALTASLSDQDIENLAAYYASLK